MPASDANVAAYNDNNNATTTAAAAAATATIHDAGMASNGAALTAAQPSARLVALVNAKSGERSAAAFVRRQLEQHLTPSCVLPLRFVPGKGLDEDAVRTFLLRTRPRRVLVAGGDGTVSLVFNITDALRAEEAHMRAQQEQQQQQQGACSNNNKDKTAAAVAVDDMYVVAVLPMGTGNDLSRSLGYGGGYVRPRRHAARAFARMLAAITPGDDTAASSPSTTTSLVRVDRFTATLCATTTSATSVPLCTHNAMATGTHNVLTSTQTMPAAHAATTTAAVCNNNNNDSSSSTKDATSTYGFTNYFSVGFEADIVSHFASFREHNPALCGHRALNKLWYTACGARSLVTAPTLSRRRVRLVVDGVAVAVPRGCKSIVVCSVLTYAGGHVLWHKTTAEHNGTTTTTTTPAGAVGACTSSTAEQQQQQQHDEEQQQQHERERCFVPPAIDDGLVEVSALFGGWHFAAVHARLRHARRLAQGRCVQLTVPAELHMQYDGEAIPRVVTSSSPSTPQTTPVTSPSQCAAHASVSVSIRRVAQSLALRCVAS